VPDTIPLIEAVHELRVARNTDVRAAISEMIDLLATGQLPMAHALIDGGLGSIDARWWWVGYIEYPNSSAAFKLVIEGEERLVRATEIWLDRGAWERQRSRIAAATQERGGPFPKWGDRAGDHPVRLLDAIRLWSPEFARLLDQVEWRSPDEILIVAHQRRRHRTRIDHPTRERFRQRAEASTGDTKFEVPDHGISPEIPQTLRDDHSRLLREWDRWDDTDRLVNGSELAARLIIEKTRAGQPYILKYAPPASRDDLGTDYHRVGEARHDGLLPRHFDIPNSMIRNSGSNWLSVRIYGGIESEAETMGRVRLERETRDAAAAAVWAAVLEKPFRERSLFGFFEIAEHLTRKSIVEPEWAKRDTVVLDVDDWMRRQEFDLSGESDVVIKINEPPFFRPFGPADIGNTSVEPNGLKVHNAQLCYLRRHACRRYIAANLSLGNAPGLLRDWFPETSPPAPLPSSGSKVAPARREPSVNAQLHAAIQGGLKTLGIPGRTVQWKPFCDRIRAECQVTAQTRGYGDRSIQRILKTISAGTDKPDK
jgi:hypothetical protein